MNIQRHFEVKTGKNKGFYIVTKNKYLDPLTYERMAKTWGIVSPEQHVTFYKHHKTNPHSELIWTHPHFVGHEFNRKIYEILLTEGGRTQFI